MVSYLLCHAIQHPLHTHVLGTAVTNTHASATPLTNTSTRVSHTCDHICHVGILYDTIIRHRREIALVCVFITWCAYNEDDLAGKSWYTRFWCL